MLLNYTALRSRLRSSTTGCLGESASCLAEARVALPIPAPSPSPSSSEISTTARARVSTSGHHTQLARRTATWIRLCLAISVHASSVVGSRGWLAAARRLGDCLLRVYGLGFVPVAARVRRRGSAGGSFLAGRRRMILGPGWAARAGGASGSLSSSSSCAPNLECLGSTAACAPQGATLRHRRCAAVLGGGGVTEVGVLWLLCACS